MKNFLAQMTGKLILLFLCTYLTFFPAWLSAKPLHQSVSAPASDALPVLATGQTQSGWSVSTDSDNHYLEVNQTDEKVVIKWKSFDIGSDAHTHFEQVDGGIALNRIYDSSPSRIFGQLTATGNIYLVNQNGILFGADSRTDIGSLVASSLNIADDDFQNGLWKYKSENFTGAADYSGPGDVVNRGWIQSSTGGNIFLLGGNVENSGTISSDEGRIFLAGSSEFEWSTVVSSTGENTREYIDTDYSGSVYNTQSGEILADVGRVGMYGDIIEHDGLIRSLSTTVTGSSIQLVASKKIKTGADSTIDSSFKELENPVVSDTFAEGREIDIRIERDSLNDGSYYGVELYGDIVFPSGEMTVDAADGGRIYLAPGASIDLSGSWVEKSALDKVLSAQLNSLELRDEFLQKNSALTGETIYFLLNEGVAIGNISEHLASRTLSVWEQSMEGGSLYLEAGQGDIIVDSGASIDISGGGIHYAGGYVQTTKLVSDGVAYDIADAPDTLVYDQLVNYGANLNDEYSDYLEAHTEGADAGLLSMSAKQILYEGDLDASAVRGYYQVNTADPVDSLGYQQSVGTVIPTGGTLILGYDPGLEFYEDEDPVVETIVIKDETSGLAEGFDPETSLLPEERNGETWLSDDLLNNAGLGSLQLNATRSLITESDTNITLASGGSLIGSARRIFHQGSIIVPSGTVQLSLKSNKSTEQYLSGTAENPDYVSIEELGQERIELADGSSISTAGEKIDNYTNSFFETGQTELFGWMNGGEIILQDQTIRTRGVVVREGATLDVSGGYMIGENRQVQDSGDAGAIEISGGAVILDGEVKGEALVGNDGGSISLHAAEVIVVSSADDLPDISEGFSSEDPVPEGYRNRLVIDDNQFDDTGFTSITLKSAGDITLEENVSLAPSSVKLTLSSPGRFSSGLLSRTNVPLEYTGSSAISLEAGTRENFSPHVSIGSAAYSQVTIKDNASIQVAPEGTISIQGDGVDISGSYSAPAGTIAVNSQSTLDEYYLRIREGSIFDTAGYNYQTGYLDNGGVLWETADGGDVSFSSGSRLVIDDSVVVDVSGSAQVTMYRKGSSGRYTSYVSASEPGSISLEFSKFGDQDLGFLTDTVFLADKQLDSLRGGSFSISALNNASLDLPIEQLQSIADNGFESLELSSGSSVCFMGAGEVSLTQGITIDTPEITGTEDDTVTLNTYWMQLLNSSTVLDGGQGEDAASFIVNAGFIDITGDLKTDGFDQVELNALYDIRLTDSSYTEGSVTGWRGLFKVDNDLTLTASRIYPTSGSLFNIEAGGDISILGSGISNTSPIYSALGSLSLSAHSINHEGVLAAPGGSISLYADETSGRIYLAEGSVLSVALEVPVNYGDVDEESLQWYGWDKITDGEISYVELDELPEKQISLTASEVIGRDDAVISLEGGESVYGYSFVPGTSGSLDPLTQSGRFVVLPAENVMGYLPGQAIYLEESSLLAEGVYVILPEAYAFLEGAMILELQGSLGANDVVLKSAEGYAMAVGYEADSLTGNHSSGANLYTVRQASDVLSEGEYEFVGLETGNGGSLEITASTTILNSEISADAKNSSYRSGIVTLSGENIVLSSTKADLGSSFDFSTALDDPDLEGDQDFSELIGTLYLDAAKLSESGLWELNIGTSALTETITFEAESVLTGSRINLAAGGDIIFNVESGIEGTGEDSEISILSDTGSLIMAQDSFVRSFDSIAIDAAGLIRGGEIQAEKQICLSSNNLYLAEEGLYEVTDNIDAVPDEYHTVEISDHLYVIVDNDYKDTFNDGMVVDAAFWQSFSSLEKISFTAREKAGFAGTIAIDAQTSEVAFDAPLIEDISAQGGGTFDVQAAEISLASTGTGETGTDIYSKGSGTVSLKADRISVGQGDIQFSNLQALNLTSTHNLTFLGEGSLDTGNADLTATAAMVTGAHRLYLEEDEETLAYEVLDFDVNSGTGKIELLQGGGTSESNDSIGGSLSFTGKTVLNEGSVVVRAGFIGFSGTGTGDAVTMGEDAVVSVSGSSGDDVDYDAGVVKYEAENGNIILSEGSETDVSAGSATGSSGTVWIRNPNGSADISGDLIAEAPSGQGGSFIMDTKFYTDFSQLAAKLNENGFHQAMDVRVRQGDISLASNVKTANFRLSADTGNVNIDSVIDASGSSGGLVEIYSGKRLTLSAATRIYAGSTGVDEDGGTIILGSGLGSDGYMNLETSQDASALLDVSAADGQGGTVYLRVPRNSDNDGINLGMNAEVIGASRMVIEGVKTYQDTDITDPDIVVWKQDASDFISETGISLDGFSVIAGIEVQSIGDLELNTDIDLSTWEYDPDDNSNTDNSVPYDVAFSFSAGNNLKINGDIIDWETSKIDLQKNSAQLTSYINFTAGATLTEEENGVIRVSSTSDPFAVENGIGNLTFADKVMVYTEDGDINFASGAVTTVGTIQGNVLQDDYMSYNHLNYNLASYSGTIRGKTGADLDIEGGVIQTATGDISLNVGGDLNLLRKSVNSQYYIGTIRTTGQPLAIADTPYAMYPDQYKALLSQRLHAMSNLWNSGGSISIQTGGDVNTMHVSAIGTQTPYLNPDAWDTQVDAYESLTNLGDSYDAWSANYQGLSATQGIAAMGGGNVSVNAMGSFYGQAGTFGEGDLSISAMGDINGRFLNKEGTLEVTSMGSIGSMSEDQVVELFDSQAILSAQGNITLASILNPGIAHQDLSDDYQWNLQYSQETSVAMTARTGDIVLTGDPDTSFGLDGSRAKLLPPSIYMNAGRDVVIKNRFYLPPSASGNIEIYAGRDITGDSGSDTIDDFGIYLSDMDPEDVYGDHSLGIHDSTSQMGDLETPELHSDTLFRDDEDSPAMIAAGRDIRNIQLAVPKAAQLSAGRDITDIRYVGQNINLADSTIFYAERDIYFSNSRVSEGNEPGILVGGPGLILVQAGNSIDLGSSEGLQATGNITNSVLPQGDNDLIVIAGSVKNFTKSELEDFFEGLRQAGVDFIEARSNGDEALANQIVADARENLILPFFGGSLTGAGDISLVNSKIFTSGGSGNIYTLAGGTIDVGFSSIAAPPILEVEAEDEENSGFYTTAGGAIKVYAENDINVNESRIMTFAGGDIDILSNSGDLNAGRGSKAAVASSNTYYVKQTDGTYKVVFEPPAVGSGVRATAPDYNDAGDIYATAWEGDIDAGEAGIAGRNVALAARQILNAQNIQTTGIAIGFAKPAESSGSIGGLSGGGGVADAGLTTEDNNQLAAAQKRFSEPLPETYTFEPRMVDVEVVGYQKNDEDEDEE